MLVSLLILQRFVSSSYPHAFEPANLAGLTKNYSVIINFDTKPNATIIEEDGLNWAYFDVFASNGYTTHADFYFVSSLQQSSVYFVLLFNSKVYYDNFVSGRVESGLEVATLTRGLGLHVHLLQPTSSYIVSSN